MLHYEEILFTYPTRLTLLAVPAVAVTLRKALPVPRTGSPATNKVNPDFAGILPENKKGEIDIEEAKKTMVEGKIYFDQSKRMYVEKVIKDGVVKIIPAAS